jgi:adenylate cyclase
VAENTKTHPITIDLNQFKLHIVLKNKIELTLHFNSPSRKFYLSLIALVVNEMKGLGKTTFISLEEHHDLLALLNETIGGSAGSSEKENLIPRIYRKWKDALPNLEEAPLFKVLGRRKEYDEGAAKTYPFAEAEKDNWANLFEYIGSEENVRLKFAVDRIGASLDDVEIVYGDSSNGDAWDRFLSDLKGKSGNLPEAEKTIQPSSGMPETPVSLPRQDGTIRQSGLRWTALVSVIVVIAGTVTFAIWKLSSKPAPIKRASLERVASPLPNKPSIAVLPFVNMSDDPKHEVFSDGLTEEIITTLSKSPYLFVIARSSTFKYKGTPVEIKQVSEELGVRYVLEGSVRRSDGKVRVTAQLIDATKGHHLWAERFDREIKEVFAIQDEIASKIMQTLQVKLQVGSYPSETRGGSKNAEAYLKSVEATEQVLSFTGEGVARAQKLFEEVIALEPDFSRGYSGLALSHGMGVIIKVSKNPKESLGQVIAFAEKAISLNETDAINHAALAYLFAITKQHDKAVVQAERALALDANSFPALYFSGIALMYSCRGKEALAAFEKAERLNPSFHHLPMHLSWAYRLLGRYEEAFNQAQKGVERHPSNPMAKLFFTATCSLTGREAEARAAAEEVLKISPNFSVERFRNDLYLLFKDKSQIDITINALRRAGLK